jgi:glyoxylase-like metal-dependent hydrolase (beta-lactamase superfamily II)
VANERQEKEMASPDVKAFFDEATNTVTYVVADPETAQCIVIDPVLDYDAAAGRTSTTSIDEVIQFIRDKQLHLGLVLETHVHADHLTAAPVLKKELQSRTAIGADITKVQEVFSGVFNLSDIATDGSQFDVLLSDGDDIPVGNITGKVMHTPGHTPACNTFVIGDAAFVGDTLFMPDFGTARCDFPGGDAEALYDSIQRILDLPSDTRLFMCHDYKGPDRDEYAWETTIAEQRQNNVHIHDGTSKEAFIAFRKKRDAQLGVPRLILPSIQVNIRSGDMPAAESNGVSYMKIPVNAI